MPSRLSPTRTRSSTAMPSPDMVLPSATGSPVNGANSRSQESKTFITPSSELLEETNVVGEELTEVVDSVAHQGQAVDAEAECEARPIIGIDVARTKHVGMHHAAPTELKPRTIGPLDVELRRWFGEREVRR